MKIFLNYLLKKFRDAFVLSIFLVLIVSGVVVYAAISWPIDSDIPTGEIKGGKFTNYFTKIFDGDCPSGKALAGYNDNKDPICIDSGGGTNYTSGTGISISGNTITNTLPGTTYTPGTGISISGNTITNTKPATTYTAGAGISISGNTITNTLPGTTYTAGPGISISGNCISNTKPATTFQMRSLTATSTDIVYSVTVTCPSGWTTIGGGGTCNSGLVLSSPPKRATLVSTALNPNGGWQTECFNPTGTTGIVFSYVTCAK